MAWKITLRYVPVLIVSLTMFVLSNTRAPRLDAALRTTCSHYSLQNSPESALIVLGMFWNIPFDISFCSQTEVEVS